MIDKLAEIFGENNVSDSANDLNCSSGDASGLSGKATAVVWPTSDEQIYKLVKLANRRKLHLSTSSPICRPHQELLRQFINAHLQKKHDPNNYNLAISFSADEKCIKSIQAKFLQYLKEVDILIDKAEAKNIYQVCFDLFSWT